eukprot:362179-Chlamydomonas_euryale.AAC.5
MAAAQPLWSNNGHIALEGLAPSSKRRRVPTLQHTPQWTSCAHTSAHTTVDVVCPHFRTHHSGRRVPTFSTHHSGRRVPTLPHTPQWTGGSMSPPHTHPHPPTPAAPQNTLQQMHSTRAGRHAPERSCSFCGIVQQGGGTAGRRCEDARVSQVCSRATGRGAGIKGKIIKHSLPSQDKELPASLLSPFLPLSSHGLNPPLEHTLSTSTPHLPHLLPPPPPPPPLSCRTHVELQQHWSMLCRQRDVPSHERHVGRQRRVRAQRQVQDRREALEPLAGDAHARCIGVLRPHL